MRFTTNYDIIRQIVESTDMFVEVGGGIRNHDSIKKYIDAGAGRVILGTLAVNNLPFLRDMIQIYGDKIAVGIDAKNGRMAINGWKETTYKDAEEYCSRTGLLGIKTVIFTDISKDGALEGTNLELYARLVKNCESDIIASGGVTRLEEIAALRDMGVHGAVIGKALYSGVLDLKKALAVARGEE